MSARDKLPDDEVAVLIVRMLERGRKLGEVTRLICGDDSEPSRAWVAGVYGDWCQWLYAQLN